MIRLALEQYHMARWNENPSNYKDVIQDIINSHNEAPSNRAPKLADGINASLREVNENKSVMNKMEQILKNRRLNQYKTKVKQKLIKKEPKFKIGDTVRYYLGKGKFSKESNLTVLGQKPCIEYTRYKKHTNSSQCTVTF